MFRTTLRLAAGAAVVAAGLLVSGCGPLKMGAAATVGNQRITGEQLDQTVKATLDAAREHQLRVVDMSSLRRGELSRKINSALLGEAADRLGVHATAGDVDAFIAQQGDRRQLETQLLQQLGAPPRELREEVRDQIIQQRIAERLAPGADAARRETAVTDLLRSVARDLGVSVSPRYGRFDTERLAVVAGGDTLSKPDGSAGLTQGQQERP